MKTTREEKDKWLSKPIEIKDELFKLFHPKESIFIGDIGACDCLSSIQYVKMFPHAMVKAFEPRRDNCAEAMENIKEYGMIGSIELFMVAIAEKEGETAFYVSHGQHHSVKNWDTGNKSSSMLKPKEHLNKHSWCKFKKIAKVQVKPLDDYKFCLDYLHIDVQGCELAVLKGAVETLKKVKAVWCEVANIELYEGQPMKSEVIDFMDEQGFEVRIDTCDKEYGDCLFVRRK